LVLAGALVALTGCSQQGIPMVGFDDNGNPVERYAEDAQFRDELSKATSQVNDSAFRALQAAPADQSGMLRSVVVGLGFNLSGGLGPIVTLGVSPKVRFVFSNSQKPIVP
jgi:hypothetical protein